LILFAALHESAIGPKQTSLVAPHMSALRGKADIDDPPSGSFNFTVTMAP
jgi:hypothetical protein